MNAVAAALYAMAASVLMAIALGFLGGGLRPWSAAAALGFGSIIAACALWTRPTVRISGRRLHGMEWAAIVLFTLFALRAFLWLVFIDGDAIKVLSPNNLGDLSLHLTYLRQFAQGTPFWPENPILAGNPLTYPLGVDLFNSLLSLVGIDDFRGLIWVGLAGSVCTGVALWRWGGAFTLAGFLCNGGLAALAFFKDGELTDLQSELAWKSLPLALFVTQRGLLFALPAGLLLLCSWRARYFQKSPGWRLPRWGEVLLYAALPVFHFHTFLFLSVLLAVWFLVIPAVRRSLAVTVAWAFAPATALVLLVTDFFGSASMLAWNPGWMRAEDETFLVFWALNFGVLPLFVGALLYQLTRPGERLWPGSLVFTGVGVFLLCCLVRFAPWAWDNTKLMLWSYLVILPFLWSHVLQRLPLMLRAASCVMLFLSGFISLLGGLNATHTGYPIASRAELDGVAFAVREIPITARFIGWPSYNHPLLLNGRLMSLGYTGHAWSHGLDWEATGAKVRAVLEGEPEWREHCAALGVRYLFWGNEESANVPDSPQPWRDSARLIASGDWGELYDLHAAPE